MVPMEQEMEAAMVPMEQEAAVAEGPAPTTGGPGDPTSPRSGKLSKCPTAVVVCSACLGMTSCWCLRRAAREAAAAEGPASTTGGPGDPAPPRSGKLSTCPASGWQYVDRIGKIQGPFGLEMMRLWHQHVSFPPTLPMRCDPEDEFAPFADLWPLGVPPFTTQVIQYNLLDVQNVAVEDDDEEALDIVGGGLEGAEDDDDDAVGEREFEGVVVDQNDVEAEAAMVPMEQEAVGRLDAAAVVQGAAPEQLVAVPACGGGGRQLVTAPAIQTAALRAQHEQVQHAQAAQHERDLQEALSVAIDDDDEDLREVPAATAPQALAAGAASLVEAPRGVQAAEGTDGQGDATPEKLQRPRCMWCMLYPDMYRSLNLCPRCTALPTWGEEEDAENAIDTARGALRQASHELESVPEDSRKDALVTMQLIQDNLAVWEQDQNDAEVEAAMVPMEQDDDEGALDVAGLGFEGAERDGDERQLWRNSFWGWSRATALDRKGLKRAVFRWLDSDCDGRLRHLELLPLARAKGFHGSDEDWAKEYEFVCAGTASSKEAGLCEGAFGAMVDAAPNWYCTDDEFRYFLGDRNGLKRAVFRRLDSDCVGRLRCLELLPFVRASGLGGCDEDWAEKYGMLCADITCSKVALLPFVRASGLGGSVEDWAEKCGLLCADIACSKEAGLSEEDFGAMVDGTGERSLCCTDDGLRFFLRAAALDRQGLKRAVFRRLDLDCDGRLRCLELLPFVRTMGYAGSDEDWAEEYEFLCADSACSKEAGFSERGFGAMVDDTWGQGWYYTEDDFRYFLGQIS